MTVPPPPDDDSLARAKRFDQVCDAFESAWLGDGRPELDDFLVRVAEDERTDLLRELLPIELHHRRRRRETLVLAEYRRRFPQIAEDWFEQTLAASSELLRWGRRGTGDSASTIDSDGPPAMGGSVPITIKYFGDYELEDLIARGGMGVVYKARQTTLNRSVAIKMILAGQLASREEVERFYTEAQAAALLDHPHIVPIYEVGEHDGHHFFSMALVVGRSLSSRLNDGPLASAEAVAILLPVVEAVEYAHQQGIIHRDLKPSNILLDEGGRPRVTDFGLAKRISDEAGLTVTGQILGTPSYMPPEQAAGRIDAVGPAADIYALGAILYSMVTGRPPFQAATTVETLRQVLEREPVSPRQLNAAIPRDLETIALKCLEKSLARRYASARELAEELRRFQQGLPILARPISRSERLWRLCRRHPAVSSLTAIAALLLIATAAVSIAAYLREAALSDRLGDAFVRQKQLTASESTAKQREQRERQKAEHAEKRASEQAELALQRARTLARTAYNSDMNRVETHVRDADYAPIDAMLQRHIPTARGEEDLRGFEWRHWWKRIHQEQNSVKLPAIAEKVALSPDGKYLAVGCEGGRAYVWDAATLKQLPLTLEIPSEHWSALQFGDKPNLLSGAGWNGCVRTWNVAEPSVALKIKPLDDATVQQLASRFPAAIAPDGKSMFRPGEGGISGWFDLETFDQTPSAELSSGVYVMPSVAGRSGPTASDFTCHVGTMSDGRPFGVLTTLPGALHQVPKPGTSNDAAFWSEDRRGVPCFAAAFSPNSRRFCGGHRSGTLHLYDTATYKPLLTWSGHSGIVWSVAFSPGGERLVSGGDDGVVAVWNVADGKLLARWPKQRSAVRDVSFAGIHQIVAASDDGAVRLWDLRSQGEPKPLRGHSGAVLAVTANDVGDTLYSVGKDRSLRVWRTAAEPQGVTLPSRQTFNRLAISADESVLLAQEMLAGVHVWDIKNGRYRGSLAGSDSTPHFSDLALSPDGKLAASAEVNVEGIRIWDTSTMTKITGISGSNIITQGSSKVSLSGVIQSVAFSPDGKLLAAQRAGTDSIDGKFVSGLSIIVYDAADHREVRKIAVASSSCRSLRLAFSNDGQRLVSFYETMYPSIHGTIAVYELTTSAKVAEYVTDDKETFESVDLSRDGEWIAVVRRSAQGKHLTRILRTKDLTMHDEFESLFGFRGILFTPDSRFLIVPHVSDEREMCLARYDLTTKTIEEDDTAPQPSINNFTSIKTLFSRSHVYEAAVGSVSIRSWPDGQELEPLQMGGSPIAAVRFSEDMQSVDVLAESQKAFNSFERGHLNLIGMDNHQPATAPLRRRGLESMQKLGLDYVSLGTRARELGLDFNQGLSYQRIEALELPFIEFADRSGVVFSLRGAASRWQKNADDTYRVDFLEPADCRAVAASHTACAFAFSDRQIIKVAASGESQSRKVGEHEQAVRSLDWSNDDRWLASAGDEGDAKIWNLLDPTAPAVTVARREEKINVVRFAPDSRTLILGLSDGRLAFCDPVNGEVRCRLAAHGSAVRDLDFTPDGRVLVSAGDDGFVQPHVAAALADAALVGPEEGEFTANYPAVAAFSIASAEAIAERKAAEALLSAGLAVRARNGVGVAMLDPAALAPLTVGDFRILEVSSLGALAAPAGAQVDNASEPRVIDAELFKNIAGLQSLRTIRLHDTPLTPAAWETIADLPELRELTLLASGLREVSMHRLATSTKLQTLVLGDTALQPESWESLERFSKLKLLAIGSADIDAAQLDRLAGMPELVAVSLPRARFATEKISELEMLPRVWALNLADSNFSDAMLDRLSNSEAIMWLNLAGTPVTLDALLQFAERRPTTTFVPPQEVGEGRWQERALLFCTSYDANGANEDVATLRRRLAMGEPITRISYPRFLLGMTSPPPALMPISEAVAAENIEKVPERDVAMLAALSDVAELNLGGAKFSDEQFSRILENKTLTRLTYGSPLGTQGVATLAKQDSLISLRLLNAGLSSDDLAGLRSHESLVELHLSSQSISPESIAAECPRLKKLSLDGTPLPSGSFKHLAGLKDLTDLTIRNIPITDEDLLSLATVAGLREVDLSGTKTTTEGQRKLKAALPKLKLR